MTPIFDTMRSKEFVSMLPTVVLPGEFFTSGFAINATSQTLATGVVRAAPVLVPEDMELSSIGAEITVLGAASTVVRCGLWKDNAGMPGELELDAGTFPADDTLGNKTIAIDHEISRGLYWAAAVSQGGSTGFRCVNLQMLQARTVSSTALNTRFAVIQTGGMAGALTNVTAPTLIANPPPIVVLGRKP